jgi:Kef-type K+ transport system membrane component KefB
MSSPNPSPLRSVSRLFGYPLMIAGAIGLFLVVRSIGMRNVAPEPPPGVAPIGSAHASTDVLLHVMLALLVIIVAARACGAVCKRLQQPPVIGEVIAGIFLGPSLLGLAWPAATAFLLPPEIAPYLSVLAQVGVVLFMFMVGLELDAGKIRNRTRATVAISHASIIAPFLLGSVLALWLYPRFSTRAVPFTVFALFLGVSLSVTAFPVLARILTDRGMHKSRMGVIALTCAAVDDVSAWCLLAFVVSVVNARVSGAAITLALTAFYVTVMLAVVRPVIARFVRAQEIRQRVPQAAIAMVVVGLLLSALVTEAVGIHAIFGAFMLGAIIPHESRLARELTAKLEDLVVILLLPAFFAFTGLRTQIGLLQGAFAWLVCGAIVLVASLGKFGGTFIAARITGLGNRDAASLGILMNTRGLMELIVLNLGLDLRILSPPLFAMLVLMAIATTLGTTPVLQALNRDVGVEGEPYRRS